MDMLPRQLILSTCKADAAAIKSCSITIYLALRLLSSLTITFANGLDTDQDRKNVGPDLDPNLLAF